MKPHYQIWPRFSVLPSIVEVAEAAQPLLFSHFERTPELWGFEIHVCRTNEGFIVPTSQMNLLFLDESSKFAQPRDITHLDEDQVYLIASMTSANHGAANVAIRRSTRAVPTGNYSTAHQFISATITRNNILTSSRDVQLTGHNKDWDTLAKHEQTLTPQELRTQAANRKLPHFGSSCLTVVSPGFSGSQHAKMADILRLKADVEIHISRTQGKALLDLSLHPEWINYEIPSAQ